MNINAIQYKFEVEDDQVNPYYHQMQEQKQQNKAEGKGGNYQCAKKLNQNIV